MVFVFVSVAVSIICIAFDGPQASYFAFLIPLPLVTLSYVDDRFNLPAGWRYIAQLLTASSIVPFCPWLPSNFTFFPILFLLIFSVTAVINFSNFVDGLDGLLAGVMSVLLATISIELNLPLSAWSLVGSLIGFLIWNWSPAKIFMGDVGSVFLGSVSAFLFLQANSFPEAFGLLLVGTPIFADACICILRRLFSGQPIFDAHRLHLFQRLHQAGWPHSRVSSLYILATVFLSVSLLCAGLSWVIVISGLELLIGIWLDQRIAVPFAVASRN